jgi:hypothetical protein
MMEPGEKEGKPHSDEVVKGLRKDDLGGSAYPDKPRVPVEERAALRAKRPKAVDFFPPDSDDEVPMAKAKVMFYDTY